MTVQEKEKQRQALPFVMALLGNAIWGFGFILERMALQAEGSTPVILLSVRFTTALVLLGIFAVARGMWRQIRGKAWKSLILLAVAQPAYYLLEAYGIQYSNATISGVVLSVAPIFAIASAALLLREYPTKKQLLFCFIPIAGVIVMTASGQAMGVIQPLGIVFLIASCVVSGLYKTVNRASSREFATFERTFFVTLGSAAFFVILAAIETRGDVGKILAPMAHEEFWIPVLGLVLLSSIAANIMCNYAAGKLSVMKASVFGAVSTVCAALGGVLYLHEPMTASLLIGALLVIVGVWLVTVSKSRPRRVRDLEPKPFFRWFEAVAAIPHGSGKEGKLAEMVCRFAEKRGLAYEKDEKGNVLVTVPPTPGYENEPGVLLQAHMDMVWVKNPGVDFDFETQPIRLVIDGDTLRADGTTLGADNAVGLATMLGLADERKKIPHPMLELLFTVEEEVGLRGIRAFDTSKLRTRRMLNMDSGYSHIICVCSAGKISGGMEREFAVSPAEGRFLRIALTGGFDGHYEVIIRQGRACCEEAMGEILEGLSCRLVSLEEPHDNCHCELTAVIAAEDAEAVRRTAAERLEDYRRRHAQDGDLRMEITDSPAAPALSREDTESVVTALRTIRPATYGYLKTDPTETATSGAIRSIRLSEGHLSLTCLARSFYDEEVEALFACWQRELSERGFDLREEDRYPGFPERQDSPFRALFEDAHRRIVGSDVTYERVQGGIEVGVVVKAIPEMDAVGYAPSSHGAHSTKERLDIGEVMPFWQVLLDVLSRRSEE